MQQQILYAKKMIEKAERIAILTGAGISTDSGIPDFRGPDGIWTKNPEAEKLSTISNYKMDPKMRRRSWDTYVWRNEWIDVEPNRGHLALKRLQDQDKLLHIATQNIDGLHQKAGCERVSELHGTLRRVVCMDCGMYIAREHVIAEGLSDPECPSCEGMLKPDVVYFGELLPSVPWDAAESAAQSCDLYIAIGTSLQVWPAADLPCYAMAMGAPLMIVNGSGTDLDDKAEIVLNGSISDLLDSII